MKIKGPVLLAVNHPNSFLDAIILDILFDQPVWSLSRGDVFKNPFYVKLLTKLRILPVYRVSEGVENLETNYKTFDACKELFRNNGVVLMFSEGKCINEWHLRPLKKGTARLAIQSWEEGIGLKVLPVGINYSSFRRFGKNIFLNFGSLITSSDINLQEADGKKNAAFNTLLEKKLNQLVYEIPKDDKALQKQKLMTRVSLTKNILLAIPAIIGLILHAPLYIPVRAFASRTKDNDHFDSIMTALLTFVYPIYLLLLILISSFIYPSVWIWSALIVVPFCAWSYVQLKSQLDR